MVPQVGSTRDVNLPQNLPEHEMLEGLEPLGVIHTASGNEPRFMSAQDVTQHARLMRQHDTWDRKTVTMSVNFTPGSVSLSAWSLTPQGYQWGAENKDLGSEQLQLRREVPAFAVRQDPRLLLGPRGRALELELPGLWLRREREGQSVRGRRCAQEILR
jgi:hypothetical protein